MTKTPISRVKEAFGDKAALVSELKKLATDELFLSRVNLAKGFERLSNTKLLRLHALLTRAKSEFGSRQGLVEAILKLENRVKDAGYKNRLERFPTPRLLDRQRTLGKQARQVTRSAAAA